MATFIASLQETLGFLHGQLAGNTWLLTWPPVRKYLATYMSNCKKTLGYLNGQLAGNTWLLTWPAEHFMGTL